MLERFGAQAWELSPTVRALSTASHGSHKQTAVASTQLGYRKCDEVYRSATVPVFSLWAIVNIWLHGRWFGRLLLEGAVLPGLGRLLRTDNMKHSPASLTQMKPIPAVSGCFIYNRIRINVFLCKGVQLVGCPCEWISVLASAAAASVTISSQLSLCGDASIPASGYSQGI